MITIPLYVLGLFIPLVLNLIPVVWMFSAMSQKIKMLEQEIVSLKRENSNASAQLNGLSVILARVDEKVIRLLHEDLASAGGRPTV